MQRAADFKAAPLVEKLRITFAWCHHFVELHLAIAVANMVPMGITIFECDLIADLDGKGTGLKLVLLLINDVLCSGCSARKDKARHNQRD